MSSRQAGGPPPTLVILAGGLGKRLGGVPKGLIRIDGVTVIERLLELAPGPVLVSANHPEWYEWLDVPVVGDAFGERGAPGGVVTALAAAGTEWVLVVGCDMPLVTREMLEQLVARARPNIDVVCFEREGQLEPLLGLYRRSLHEDWAARLEGQPSLRSLIESTSYETVQAAEPWRLASLNSPKDIESFRTSAASGTVRGQVPTW